MELWSLLLDTHPGIASFLYFGLVPLLSYFLISHLQKGTSGPNSAKTPTTTSPQPKPATTKMSSATSLKPIIETLISGERHLTATETQEAFTIILTSKADPHQIASLLTLLRARGETPDEITGMIRAMNDACHRVEVDRSVYPKLLDIVGTGGDGADTINISTASVVLAAACGCTVAKAGNRSVSSACGSADVLEAIGVKIDLTPAQTVQCVQKCGIAFMYAPVNHPAMRFVAPVRRALGVRTCFNILGPMTNAAGADRAVIGVFDGGLMPLMAGALKMVGRVEHAVVIHGVGLDEISPLGPATILEIKNTAPPGETKTYTEKPTPSTRSPYQSHAVPYPISAVVVPPKTQSPSVKSCVVAITPMPNVIPSC